MSPSVTHSVPEKDTQLSALEAVALGRKLRTDLTAKMLRSEMSTGDLQVIVVFARHDLSELIPLLLSIPEGGPEAEVVEAFAGALAIGFLTFLWAKKQPKAPIYGDACPLVANPRAVELLAQALDAYERKLRASLKAGGVNLPAGLPDVESN